MRSRYSMNDMKGSKPSARAPRPPTREEMARGGKFSPHDAAFDGAVCGTDRLSVGDGSSHPGDLRVPVVDNLRIKLNLDDLTTKMVDVGSDYKALSSTAAIVNSNDVACVDRLINNGRHDEV